MPLDYQTLDSLRQHHPTWRVLTSPHAPLVIGFLYKVFVIPNERVIAQADLIEALEDELFTLRELVGPDTFPKDANSYLNDWAAPEKGWLRKFYRQDSDEVQFDLTPAMEKAISWLEALSSRSFVGTESRLLTLFELLRQLSEGSTDDPNIRLKELQKRRADIDAEIAQVREGKVPLLDSTAQKDRFMQFRQQARELLADFREVENNFRGLDRRVRERIALWEGKKGELLQDIIGERDAIANSDQGRSFQAFWDFLMSPQRQEEFTEMLEQVLDLPAVHELKPDTRTHRIHYDWLAAGEHTQRTVAQLSQQLRRFLDDKAWLENRRIMDILHGIEGRALELRETMFSPDMPDVFTDIEETSASIELPMERPLYSPPLQAAFPNIKLLAGDEALDSSALFSQVVIDKAALARHIRQSLQNQSQVSLAELCETRPLQQGLAELVAYLELAGNRQRDGRFTVVVEETIEDIISWQAEDGPNRALIRRAQLPRIIYYR